MRRLLAEGKWPLLIFAVITATITGLVLLLPKHDHHHVFTKTINDRVITCIENEDRTALDCNWGNK